MKPRVISCLGVATAAVALCLSMPTPATGAQYDNGKYNLVVAIDPEMAEDQTIIGEITSMIEEGSQILHTALRGQAMFGEVVILVPGTWDGLQPTPGAKYLGETVSGADLFVRHVSSNEAQCSACASPGRIQMNRPALSGRTLVHEWGHHRYGLGDEYCDYVYQEGTWYKVFGTEAGWNRCTGLQEIMWPCTKTELHSTGACRSPISEDTHGAAASLMHREHHVEITAFCDSSSDPRLQHNASANNHHNRIWGNKSTWAAIEQHVDGLRHTGGKQIPYEPPHIVLKKATHTDVVLVLDVSGSMTSHHRISNMARAAEYFVERAELGTSIGIVRFSHDAELLLPLTELESDLTRQQIREAIPRTANGRTSIGDGLIAAREALEATAGRPKVIMLLTDGVENEPVKVEDALPAVVDANITVYTVGLGAASDGILLDIASSTGGTYFFVPDDNVHALNDAFATVAQATAKNPASTVASDILVVPPNGTAQTEVAVDPTLGQNTLFTISASPQQIEALRPSLVQPDGTVVDETAPGYFAGLEVGMLLFRIEGIAQEGTWSVALSNSADAAIEATLAVSSAAPPLSAPVTLTASLSTRQAVYPEPVAIEAMLASTDAIIYANVTAEVTLPSGERTVLALLDNGQGSDRFPLDGVYSSYFSQYSDNGRYSVEVRADDNELAAEIGAQFTDGVASTSAADEPLGQSSIPVGTPFERLTSAGGFELSGYVSGDVVPPARVVTLNVVRVEQDPPAVVLGWLAPGDDLDQGAAASYDLRASQDPISEESFEHASAVALPFAPSQAGYEEQHAVTGLACSEPFSFGLKSTDAAGNTSALSNIVETVIVDETRPTVSCPQSRVLECPADTTVAANGSATAVDACGHVDVDFLDEVVPAPAGSPHRVDRTWTARDLAGNATSCLQQLQVVDSVAPVVVAPQSAQVECDRDGGVGADTPFMAEWLASAVASDTCDGDHVVLANDAPELFPVGCQSGQGTTVMFAAQDPSGNMATSVSDVTVVDTAAPAVSCSVRKDRLKAAKKKKKGKLVDVGFTFEASDTCSNDRIEYSITVTSDEDPDKACGGKHGGKKKEKKKKKCKHHHTCPDAVVTPEGSVLLRAETSKHSDGRVYVVRVTAVDECGNQDFCEARVDVPPSCKHESAVDSGQDFDATTCSER